MVYRVTVIIVCDVSVVLMTMTYVCETVLYCVPSSSLLYLLYVPFLTEMYHNSRRHCLFHTLNSYAHVLLLKHTYHSSVITLIALARADIETICNCLHTVIYSLFFCYIPCNSCNYHSSCFVKFHYYNNYGVGSHWYVYRR